MSKSPIITLVLLALVGCASHVAPRPPTADATIPDDDDEPSSSTPIGSGGNQHVPSFGEAKRLLHRIYDVHRIDLYCGCAFSNVGGSYRVDLTSCGYSVARDETRAERIEWEHAVAAATFGRTFHEWTEGDPRCVDGKGRRFSGRKCAAKSREFARMEADLHNLFPVVGEVNGLRSDFPMGTADSAPARPQGKEASGVYTFGRCQSAIVRGVFQPRPEIRGDVARASLYMERTYPEHVRFDAEHRALFERWSAEDPPDAWEKERNRVIFQLQGNDNPFIDDRTSH
jgi:deoxyribonuclease-1